MTRATHTPASVGQQAPPMRTAAPPEWMALRVARGSLLSTAGTAGAELDERRRRLHQRSHPTVPGRSGRILRNEWPDASERAVVRTAAPR